MMRRVVIALAQMKTGNVLYILYVGHCDRPYHVYCGSKQGTVDHMTYFNNCKCYNTSAINALKCKTLNTEYTTYACMQCALQYSHRNRIGNDRNLAYFAQTFHVVGQTSRTSSDSAVQHKIWHVVAAVMPARSYRQQQQHSSSRTRTFSSKCA